MAVSSHVTQSLQTNVLRVAVVVSGKEKKNSLRKHHAALFLPRGMSQENMSGLFGCKRGGGIFFLFLFSFIAFAFYDKTGVDFSSKVGKKNANMLRD